MYGRHAGIRCCGAIAASTAAGRWMHGRHWTVESSTAGSGSGSDRAGVVLDHLGCANRQKLSLGKQRVEVGGIYPVDLRVDVIDRSALGLAEIQVAEYQAGQKNAARVPHDRHQAEHMVDVIVDAVPAVTLGAN